MSTTVEEIEKTETTTDKKDKLLLDSLEIKGYRCFEHLTIEKLGRVNLIVGKNNVGKTALLEGLWLFANGGYESLMFEILRERNEIPPFQNGTMLVQPESSKGLRNLFFNRPSLDFIPAHLLKDFNVSFQIGEHINEDEKNLSFISKVFKVSAIPVSSNSMDAIPQTRTESSFDKKIENHFIKAGGLSEKKLVGFWDKIEQLVLEDLVIKALKIVANNLVDIRFSGYPSGAFSRVPVVRLEKATERIPLRSLGDGMTRLLGIASTLINCRNGILIIDEIESGLHYSVLPDVWKLIFKTAKDLNVQVFATTHSKDCIEAFAQAAVDSPEDGMLVQLIRQGENIVAKTIEEERLAQAINYEVEVR